MSAFPPPTYYFTGINFNSSYFAKTTAGLTETQANALYLKKTVSDTATAVETFSAGILTSNVNSLTTTGGMNLAASSVSGIVGIATAGGRTGALNINNGAGSSTVISVGGGSTSTFLNGSTTITNARSTNYDGNTTTSNCDIAKTNTTGIVTLGKAIDSVIAIGNSANGSAGVNLNGATNIARNTNGTNPTYLECVSGLTNQYIDFHCNSANAVDYDARIACSGGTATLGNGDLAITSRSFSVSSPITLGTSATVNTQLGYKEIIINGGTASSSATLTVTISTYTPPSDGTWLFQFYFQNGNQVNNLMLSNQSTFTGQYGFTTGSSFSRCQMSYVSTGTSPVYVLLQSQIVNTLNNIFFIVTRIG